MSPSSAAAVEQTVELLPITVADLPEVARFLHDRLDARVPVDTWASDMVAPWPAEQPNHGFLLRDRGAVVGVHLAFYSERIVDGVTRRFCNLAAWCVADSHRAHGLRLLRALLRQPGYDFTDLSPSESVRELNSRLGFRALDTSTVVVPNLPWPLVSHGVRVVSDPHDIVQALQGDDLTIYRDHADAAAAQHAVIVRGPDACHVMYRRMRRKNLPLFASLVYVGNRHLFEATAPHFFRHLLLRRGVPGTLIESHVAATTFAGARPVSGRAKMFRSDTLRPGDVDYLYTELTCMRW